MIKLQGNRIHLRDWVVEDLLVYRKWLIGNHQWKKFDAPYYKKLNEEEIEKHLIKKQEWIEEGDFPNPRKKLVIALKDNNTFLGVLGWYWESKETFWLSTGLVIHDDTYWSKGIGYEAFGLWCQYLLDNMPELARLDLRSWSGNFGMMKLAEKLGFQLEATFRNARIVDGEYFDGVGYGILKEEWQNRYPDGFAEHLKQMS